MEHTNFNDIRNFEAEKFMHLGEQANRSGLKAVISYKYENSQDERESAPE